MAIENILDSVDRAVVEAVQRPYRTRQCNSVGGGCINACYRLTGETSSYFVKVNNEDCLDMFRSEVAGLTEIAASESVKVPSPISTGLADGYSFLVLDWLELENRKSSSDKLLGELLAKMHAQRHAYFGWHQNNSIGSSQQINTPKNDWVKFWRENRLAFQLELAESNGFGASLAESGAQLCDGVDKFFNAYPVFPSLLHGDLWAGNAARDPAGNAVIFDPACYYGDREVDLAMTELFGGFGKDFYQSYNANLGLDAGYKVRKTLYNFYHILNHLNIFGSSYLGQAELMVRRLLAELRG